MPFHSLSSSACPFTNLQTLSPFTVLCNLLLHKAKIVYIKSSLTSCTLSTQRGTRFKQKKPHKKSWNCWWSISHHEYHKHYLKKQEQSPHRHSRHHTAGTPWGTKDRIHKLITPFLSKSARREKTSKGK